MFLFKKEKTSYITNNLKLNFSIPGKAKSIVSHEI